MRRYSHWTYILSLYFWTRGTYVEPYLVCTSTSTYIFQRVIYDHGHGHFFTLYKNLYALLANRLARLGLWSGLALAGLLACLFLLTNYLEWVWFAVVRISFFFLCFSIVPFYDTFLSVSVFFVPVVHVYTRYSFSIFSNLFSCLCGLFMYHGKYVDKINEKIKRVLVCTLASPPTLCSCRRHAMIWLPVLLSVSPYYLCYENDTSWNITAYRQ